MKTQYIFFISLLIFISLLFTIPSHFISSDLGNTILTITTFLFGILAGFYIIVTTTDYNNLKSSIAAETAGWISLYQNLSSYDREASAKFAKLLDKYIQRTFDYELIDYARETQKEFQEIMDMMRFLPLKNESTSLYEKMIETVEDIVRSRQQLLVLGTRTLSIFQWVVLFSLAALVAFSLYGLRSGEAFFDIVTVVISSSIVLILSLIRELDLYVWNEKTFGYDVFENVLKSMGLLPYYPAESLKKGRIHPTEKEYRVGIYTDFSKSYERKIEIQKLNKIS